MMKNMWIWFLILSIVFFPCIYWIFHRICCSSYQEEQNRNSKIFKSKGEILLIVLGELGLSGFWYHEMENGESLLLFILCFVMMTALAAAAKADLLERIVPNRLLVLLLLFLPIFIGCFAIRDIESAVEILPDVFWGFAFSAFSFGLGYLLSRGSMGAGDVKLAIVIGLYFTGKYVVGVIFYGCIVAAVYSGVQLLRRKITRKTQIPFVPFLYLGAVINSLRFLF